jgi:hypothetical protein
VVAIAGLVLVAVLVRFALQLHSTQTTTRRDVEARFRDRAEAANRVATLSPLKESAVG